MALVELEDWLDEYSGSGFIWFAKRLSGNDTRATNAHQAGPYIPKSFLFRVFPALNQPEAANPDIWFDLYVDSHPDYQRARAVWYNNKGRDGTRDEARLTNLGGGKSALLDPESTGAVSLFIFSFVREGAPAECHLWVCRNELEEDLIEDRLGPIEPGSFIIWPPALPGRDITDGSGSSSGRSCWLSDVDMPPGWLEAFPSGKEIVAKSFEFRPAHGSTPDRRLLRRRNCEYEIFRSVEHAHIFPRIARGFESVEEFISYSQQVLQRRKARSGHSLELQIREILLEERLEEGKHFSHQPESDPAKRPDFLFPSEARYKDSTFPDDHLRMLAVKTSCRDRWRQILNEAKRIRRKHLLTLQEGVSVRQFAEMTESGIQLVVPEPLFSSFPDAVKPHLQTLESFLADVRLLPA